MVYAYMRQVPGFPHLTTQQSDILSFSLKHALKIDKEVVEYATKNLLLDLSIELVVSGWLGHLLL